MHTYIRPPEYNRFLGIWDTRVTTFARNAFGSWQNISNTIIRADTEQECWAAAMEAGNRQARENGVSMVEFEY